MLLRRSRPPLAAGMLATAVLVTACTAAVYPLKQVTSVSSLGVVYLLGVVVISTFWGAWLGVAIAFLSAAAFNFFHLPPVGRFTIADSRTGWRSPRSSWPRSPQAP
jgi:two-component system, OmpR family, sensor histidine kinase KdpD